MTYEYLRYIILIYEKSETSQDFTNYAVRKDILSLCKSTFKEELEIRDFTVFKPLLTQYYHFLNYFAISLF